MGIHNSSMPMSLPSEGVLSDCEGPCGQAKLHGPCWPSQHYAFVSLSSFHLMYHIGCLQTCLGGIIFLRVLFGLWQRTISSSFRGPPIRSLCLRPFSAMPIVALCGVALHSAVIDWITAKTVTLCHYPLERCYVWEKENHDSFQQGT